MYLYHVSLISPSVSESPAPSALTKPFVTNKVCMEYRIKEGLIKSRAEQWAVIKMHEMQLQYKSLSPPISVRLSCFAVIRFGLHQANYENYITSSLYFVRHSILSRRGFRGRYQKLLYCLLASSRICTPLYFHLCLKFSNNTHTLLPNNTSWITVIMIRLWQYLTGFFHGMREYSFSIHIFSTNPHTWTTKQVVCQ